MPLFLIDLEQCPPFYRTDLKRVISEEIQNVIKVKKVIEDHNEIETHKDEYQAASEYIKFLNKGLDKLEALINYDHRAI